jgi:hypothetical protein
VVLQCCSRSASEHRLPWLNAAHDHSVSVNTVTNPISKNMASFCVHRHQHDAWGLYRE